MFIIIKYIDDFMAAFISLSLNDKFTLSLFFYYFIKLFIFNFDFRNFIYLTILSLSIYILSENTYCETPITKTVFEKLFENKKVTTFLFFSGVTLCSSIYVYKKYYPMVEPFLHNIKNKEYFMGIEKNHIEIEMSYRKYEQNYNTGYEICFLDNLPNVYVSSDLNPNLLVFTPKILKEMRDHSLNFLIYDKIMISNLKYLDSRKIKFDDLEALAIFQNKCNKEIEDLTFKTIQNNECLGWVLDSKIVESATIIEDQVYLFEDLSKYAIFLDYLLSTYTVSKVFNNVFSKSEDFIIISGYCFFSIISIFTYALNPIPYEYFLKSFYRFFNRIY